MDMNSYKPSYFFYTEPDFSRPLFKVTKAVREKILIFVTELYGKRKAEALIKEIERVMAVFFAHKSDMLLEWEQQADVHQRFSEKDVILITYGDIVADPQQKPLQIMSELTRRYLKGVFNTIHILPFFPSSSDRGFAIRDFRQVDPNLGTWDDINDLKDDFKLMFDGVFNHISSKSFWFQEFLNGNPLYADYFTAFDAKRGVSQKKIKALFRPRTSDVLTPYYTYNGKKLVWTTFSPDQVDLKFQNPRVLLRIIEILLYYIRRGADLVRLDAVTYLWDELGTTGAHLNQTHTIIKLFRTILDAVAPYVVLVTETNVPHDENISYFGSGSDEAQMVYNFALPPLILHTFYAQNTAKIMQWASELKSASDTTTFLNFLDSHDGIGVLGVRGILSDDEIHAMSERVIEHGGLVSHRREKDGSNSIYEYNITSYSALNLEDSEPQDIQIKRYIAARSIPLVLVGIPGVYIHGLLGSCNDIDAVTRENDKRSINRNVLNKDELVKAISDRRTTTSQVSAHLSSLIQKRIAEKAFHPNAGQQVVFLSDSVFSVVRTSLDGKEKILAMTNVTDKPVTIKINTSISGLAAGVYRDILTGKDVDVNNVRTDIVLKPYEVIWLKKLRKSKYKKGQ